MGIGWVDQKIRRFFTPERQEALGGQQEREVENALYPHDRRSIEVAPIAAPGSPWKHRPPRGLDRGFQVESDPRRAR